MGKDRRYWDSNCFLGWLKNEPDKYKKCQAVIEKAELGEIEIITSAFTLAEVLYLRKDVKIGPEQSGVIRKFFENEYILLVNVTREVAEIAQDVVWNYQVHPKDAIHVASALKLKVPILDTFDGDLIGLSNKIGDPPIIITEPNIQHQEDLFEGKEDRPEDAK